MGFHFRELMAFLKGLKRAPGAVWCWSVHSWKRWGPVGRVNGHEFTCVICKRNWYFAYSQ